LLRSLGEFVGHIAKGLTSPIKTRDEKTKVVRRDVEERSVPTPQGPMTLRRTTIDEVEFPKPPQE
jgi:hypothetical protein